MWLSGSVCSLFLLAIVHLSMICSYGSLIRRRRDSSVLVSPVDNFKGRKEIITQETNPDDKFIPFLMPFHIKPDVVKFTKYFVYAMELMQEEGGMQKLMDMLLKPNGAFSKPGGIKFGDFGRKGGATAPAARSANTRGSQRRSTSSGSDWSASSSDTSSGWEDEDDKNQKRGRSMRGRGKKMEKTGSSIVIFKLDDTILEDTKSEEDFIVHQLADKFKLRDDEFHNIRISSRRSFLILTRTEVANLIRNYQKTNGLFIDSINDEIAEVDMITVAAAYKRSDFRS